VVLPLLESIDVNGKKPSRVTGFAVIFLRNIPVRPGDDLIGEFLEIVVPGH
jgi:hypothetical protein